MPAPNAAADAPVAVTTTSCLIVDDHPAIRLGLSGLLAGEPGLDVAASCSSAEEALAFAQRTRVDVAVVDYQLGGRSGLWLSRRLAGLADPPGVVVYSAFSNHLLAAACVVARASALVSKAALGETLVARIREVADGHRRLPSVPPALTSSLGRRFDVEQQAIFGLMSSGVAPDEAAATLRLTVDEVDAQLWRMLDALQRPDPGPVA